MKKKYKIIAVLCGLGSVTALAASFFYKPEVPRSVTMIGGADGPTKVFLAGKVENTVVYFVLAGILGLIAAISLVIGKKKKKQ